MFEIYPAACRHIRTFPVQTGDAIAYLGRRLEMAADGFENEEALEEFVREGRPHPQQAPIRVFGRAVKPDDMQLHVPIELKLLRDRGLPEDGTLLGAIQTLNYSIIWGCALLCMTSNDALDSLLVRDHCDGATPDLIRVLHLNRVRVVVWSFREKNGRELACADR